jgi:pyruvate dehydrogenase E2 component (dihydrolipoamide acetyltransferase)
VAAAQATPAPSPELAPPAVTGPEAAATVPTSSISGPAAPPAAGPRPAPRDRLAISPRASRRAAELGVDPRSLTGTGPGGRIVERDVEAARAQGPAGSPSGSERADRGDARPLSRLRQVIARRLTESVATVPQFDVTVAVDMTGLVALRAELRADASPVTLTDLVHAATVQTLVELPLVNSLTDGTTLWVRERVHLGIAVSVPEGLLVPVVRDADRLHLLDLHDRAVAAIEGARAGRLGPDELSGSTFTISNMGMLGVERFTAIVNPGESAILAVSSVRAEPVALGGGIAVRQVMRLTLTADHRLVDGELAARFLNAVRRRLEDPEAYRASLGIDRQAQRA